MIFLGAIGLRSIGHADGTEISPRLRLRDQLGRYAGVRPVRAYPNAPQRLADSRAAGIDLVILREPTEGLFRPAAARGRRDGDGVTEVRDTLRIRRTTPEELHRFAFRLAEKRRVRGRPGHVTCVDKANVFRSMASFFADSSTRSAPTFRRSGRGMPMWTRRRWTWCGGPGILTCS